MEGNPTSSSGDGNDLWNQVSEEVKCHVCLDLFEEPRMLECGHTFCLHCLANIEKKGKIDCPICRQSQKLGKKGIDALPKNRYVANIVERLKRNSTTLQQSVPFPYNLYVSSTSNQTPPPPIQTDVPTYAATSPPAPSVPIPTPQTVQPSAPPLEILDSTSTTSTSTSITNSNLYPQIPFPLPDPESSLKSQTSSTMASTPNPMPIPIVPPVTQNPAVSQNQAQKQQNGKEEQSSGGLLSTIFSFFSGSTEDSKPQSTASTPSQPVYFAPFEVQSTQIYTLFKKWITSLWFAPSDFTDKLSIGTVQAIYIPFWCFSALTNTAYSGQVCRIVKDPYTKKKFEQWTAVQGTFAGNYQNLMVCGVNHTLSTNIVDLLNSLDDWTLSKAVMTAPAGTPTLPKIEKACNSKNAWTQASSAILKTEEDQCLEKLKRETKADKVEQFKLTNVAFTNVAHKLIYLPVYISSYFYEGREYNFVVSGQNGSIKGQRPYGLGKLGQIGKGGMDLIGGLVFGKK